MSENFITTPSENLATALVSCIADGVYMLDDSGRVILMNAAAERMLGYSTSELYGREMHDVIHYLRPDGSTQGASECRLLSVLSTGAEVRADDDVFVTNGGKLMPVAYTSAPLMVDGRIAGAVLVFRDITAAKMANEERERLFAAERAARAEAEDARERYMSLIEAMPVHVWTATPDGSLSFVSSRMAAFAGKRAEAVIAGGLTEMAHPADAASIRSAWQKALADGTPLALEARLLRGVDFKYLWHIIRAVPCRDDNGRITEWIGTNSDIDGEKRATEVRDAALAIARIERERLLRVFNSAPAVMAVYRGPSHVVTLVNPMWERFVGKREVIGRPIRDVFPELEGQGVLELLDRVFTTGEMFQTSEMRVEFDRDGTGERQETYWSFVVQQLPGDSPETTDILVFAVEVTEQVLAKKPHTV